MKIQDTLTSYSELQDGSRVAFNCIQAPLDGTQDHHTGMPDASPVAVVRECWLPELTYVLNNQGFQPRRRIQKNDHSFICTQQIFVAPTTPRTFSGTMVRSSSGQSQEEGPTTSSPAISRWSRDGWTNDQVDTGETKNHFSAPSIPAAGPSQ